MTVWEVRSKYGTMDVDYYRDGKLISRSDTTLMDEVAEIYMGDDGCWHVILRSKKDET